MIEDILDEELKRLGSGDAGSALKELKVLESGPLGKEIDLFARGALASPSPARALINLTRISESIDASELTRFISECEPGHLITLAGSSEMLVNSLCRHPEFFAPLFFGGELTTIKDYSVMLAEVGERTGGLGESGEVGRELRIYKQREFLRIGLRDLLGLSELPEVVAEISDLASAALEVAHAFSLAEMKESYGAPLYKDEHEEMREAELVVIGMGKLGGRELNYSSDIDIIYIYTTEKGESEGVEGRPNSMIDLHSFFVKLSSRVRKLINDLTDEGMVFRVDLDLRPDGRSGEVANSLASAELYYESWGRTWERSAMIKARPVAGSSELGEDFLRMIEPFVYRRYLDFTAIDEIKGMKEKLDLNLLKRSPDKIDVKLGAGGIREIEFFCQALQLIHAGKDRSLREKGTLKTIEKLKAGGFLSEEHAARLCLGYIFLRNVEHRLQIIEGRQTQAIPALDSEIRRIGAMMGFSNTDRKGFLSEYAKTTDGVYEVYRSLFYSPSEELTDGIEDDVRLLFGDEITEEEALEKLTTLGFRDSDAALKRVRFLVSPAFTSRRSAKGRLLLEKLAPFLLSRAAASPDPDMSLKHLERFITAVGAKTTFYALLSENLPVAELLANLFGSSEFLASTLVGQPGVVETLLSSDLAKPVKSKAELTSALQKEITEADGYEELLNALRRFKRSEVLRIGTNDIMGRVEIRDVASQVTTLAECVLDGALDIAGRELFTRYGKPGGGARFAVLGLGKLGTRELGYGADLDILFAYEDLPEKPDTTGERAISNTEYFIKLGQKIISALTVMTGEGRVYPVDMRLRPSGSSGPLVLSNHSLIDYHATRAEPWERHAVLKARFAAGDGDFGREVVSLLKRTVYSNPPTGDDARELMRIRERMEKEIAKEGEDKYNIKTGRGAVVDIEFIAQLLEMKHAARLSALESATLPEALEIYRDDGIITAEEALLLKEAYAFYRFLENKQRIVHDRSGGDIRKGSEELSTLARMAGYGGQSNAEEALLSDYLEHAEKVRATYLRVMNCLVEDARPQEG